MKKALIFALFTVGLSFASEGGSGGEMFWKTVNTIILFALIFIVAKKYIVKYFSDRKKSIENMILEAQKAKEESEKALAEAKQKLEEAKQKYTETLKIAEETAKQEREVAINEAKEIAERIKAQAKEAVEIEIQKGQAILRKYAVEKALEISEKLVKDQINPEVNKAVIKKTLKTLEA
jgi:F-type H+-transporting ATPase subunit b